MNQKKMVIEQAFNAGDMGRVRMLLDQYHIDYPYDLDYLMMETNYYVNISDYDTAYRYALRTYYQLPLSADANYNLACVLELLGQYLEAFIYYQRSCCLYEYDKDSKVEELCIDQKCDAIMSRVVEQAEHELDHKEFQKIQRNISLLQRESIRLFGLKDRIFNELASSIGDYYRQDNSGGVYIGVLKDQFDVGQPHNNWEEIYDVANWRDELNLIKMKGEFVPVMEGQQCLVDEPQDIDYLLPIAASYPATQHQFVYADTSIPVLQTQSMHFSYYRVKNRTEVISSNPSYYGNPIPLMHDPKRKRLVLNIFVDGLSAGILQGEDFIKHMPHTYSYFKSGVIFDRAYNAAEWTYPSIVNYVTGLYTAHHMLFHNELDQPMSFDYPTLAETFHNAGYYTAYFGGNWRITPNYGHDRGYDRFVYQHQKVGFKTEEVIAAAMNHIEAFQDTDQFMWISIGDLHDIADMEDLPVDVLRDLTLEQRIFDYNKVTSVKQGYDDNKAISYKRLARHIDMWLNILFEYIQSRYKDDEVIISVFSDHGQGYLVPEGAHFLAEERSNVAFMFKGGIASNIGRSQEIVSSLDYSIIMRRLAGVTEPEIVTDGNLPEVFGGTKREYALTESIHPNDNYYAAVYTELYTYYFTNFTKIITEGRFELGDYEFWAEDGNGQRLVDQEQMEYYKNLILHHIAHLILY